MKVMKIKLIKLEDVQRDTMYRDYLARLERDRQADRPQASLWLSPIRKGQA